MVGLLGLAIAEDMSQSSVALYGLASICLYVRALVLLLLTSGDAEESS